MTTKPTLNVKVYSPSTTYINEPAYSVTAANSTGQFDILPQHKNFLTVLEPCDLVVVSPIKTHTLQIQSGVLHVKNDQLTVYLDS